MKHFATAMLSCVFLASIASAQTAASYIPLEEGNQWVYQPRQAGAEPFTVRIAGSTVVSGRTYYRAEGFPQGTLLLRNAEDGTTYLLDEEAGVERIWLRGQAAEGSSYESGIDRCSPNATIHDRDARYSGPLGEFGDALVIRYSSASCRDAGLTDEVFLQFLGLVSRTETTIAGPRTFELVYARVGGRAFTNGELAFSLSIDKAKYLHNLLPVIDPDNLIPRLTARITLRHNQPQPVVLRFPSSQEFEFVIRDSKGETVFFWSADKLFAAVVKDISFPAGERNWVVQAPLGTSQPLPAGRYTAEAYLTTDPPRQFVASVSFEISDGSR
ncbi:MAG TPA: BsuPI-related putative proteinase inhibitor [Bryobacteraceae bacterium]|nr:BsuPI-related putative proteinase inhibitor [Bryobacteraceae bacterium]